MAKGTQARRPTRSDLTRPEPGAHSLPGHRGKAPECVCVGGVCGGKGPQRAPQPCYGADSHVSPHGASPCPRLHLPTRESRAKAGGTPRGTSPLEQRVLPKAVRGNPSRPHHTRPSAGLAVPRSGSQAAAGLWLL